MSDAWLDLLIVFGLVAVNALLSGSEMALVSLRERQLTALETAGRRGRRVAELARSPSRYLAALQLGITLAGFLASASAAVELSESVAPALGFLGGSARAGSVVVVTVLVSLVTIVLGELVPKRIAMLHAERWSLLAVIPLTWFMNLMRPVLALLELLTETIVHVTGNRSDPGEGEISDAEFLRLARRRSSFDPLQQQIISEAVAIGDRTLRHILVPRPHVVSIDADTDAATALDRLRTLGLSKAPLIEHDLDHPIGQIHILDLVHADGPVRGLAHPVLALPETLPALGALRRLQASSTKLAVVIDEHGGTSGIVTFEDLVEELVGEVEDESDRLVAHGAADEVSGEVIVLPGSFPIHRLDELGLVLPPGDYVTIAGLVLDQLGHIPELGEHVEIEGSTIRVTGTDQTSITSVELRPSPDAVVRPGSPDTE
jgi:putative hemolysin